MQEILTVPMNTKDTTQVPVNGTFLSAYFIGNQIMLSYLLNGTLEGIEYVEANFTVIDLRRDSSVPDGYRPFCAVTRNASFTGENLYIFTR